MNPVGRLLAAGACGMETGGRLVAGSRNRNEFVVINADDAGRHKPTKYLSGQICEICGDEIEMLEKENDNIKDKNDNEKEFFVACNECAFPVCRGCYEYERREGTQACPRCKTRYRRHKGSPRVEGDEEEDGDDDLDKEFSFNLLDGKDIHGSISSMTHCRHNSGLGSVNSTNLWGNNSSTDISGNDIASLKNNSADKVDPKVPLLTYRGEDNEISSCSHCLVPYAFANPSMSSTNPRPINPDKDISIYGYGSVTWNDRIDDWRRKQLAKIQKTQSGGDGHIAFDEPDDTDLPMSDESRQPLSRKRPIASSKINPYRIIIVLRLVILGLFFHYRILHPVPNAYGLWLTSVICEIWFSLSWILDQFPKWYPIERETYLDRLSLRYEKEGKPSELAAVDIFVSTVDPMKEPPLITANTVLSILSVDYPVEKVSCYVSDDGAAMLTFEALSETSLFAKKWVPFCKKFSIEPRAPEWYFSQKINYLKGKIDPAFVGERRAMKREYEEFKIRINGLISMSQKVPEEGWTMQHGAPWPGNNAQDHPGMVQVFLGLHDSLDANGDYLPRLVYVSREKRPGFNHHKKAGAMNALIRVSAVLSNAPFILNLDCRHYINNSRVLREAMCFMMDPTSGSKICFVQFPYKFDGNDQNNSFSDRVVFFNINMKGLDGIQGPINLGTGCVFRRQALYGIEAPMKEKHTRNTCNCWPIWCFLCSPARRSGRKKHRDKKNKKYLKQHREISTQVHSLETIPEEVAGEDVEMSSLMPFYGLEKKFGRSPAFIASTLTEHGEISMAASSASALEEALHVISCGYEGKTAWGKEVGWIYGSVAEDVVTGFKMHCHGWRSVYCMPRRTAFKGSAPADLLDYLLLVLRRAQGSVEIFLSKHCPIWYGYGGGMKCLQRLSYISLIIYPWMALPLITYCILPAFCLLTGKFFIPEVTIYLSIILMTLFASIIATSILEMNWGEVTLDDWWKNEQVWMISSTSSQLFALFSGIVKVIAGIKAKLFLTHTGEDSEKRSKWSTLLIPPMTLILLSIIGLMSGISNAVNGSYDSWGPLFGKVFFAIWVIIHLYPCLKGVMRKQNRVPTIVVVWSILLTSVCSLLWVRLNPFVSKSDGPVLEVCGLDCD